MTQKGTAGRSDAGNINQDACIKTARGESNGSSRSDWNQEQSNAGNKNRKAGSAREGYSKLKSIFRESAPIACKAIENNRAEGNMKIGGSH